MNTYITLRAALAKSAQVFLNGADVTNKGKVGTGQDWVIKEDISFEAPAFDNQGGSADDYTEYYFNLEGLVTFDETGVAVLSDLNDLHAVLRLEGVTFCATDGVQKPTIAGLEKAHSK